MTDHRPRRTAGTVLVGVPLMAMTIVLLLSGCGTNSSSSGTVEASATSQASGPGVSSTPTTIHPTSPTIPSPEQKAVAAAKANLASQGWSRQALINELSDPYGDNYPVDVATAAVDSLHEDWNAQAAKAAQEHLDTMDFSCSALIDLLDADDGEGDYTEAQATYGAHQTKACD